MKPIKVILDTNVWISMLIGGRVAILAPLLDNGKVSIVMSQQLLKELEHVATRTKFRKYFPENVAIGLVNHIKHNSEIYTLGHIPARCRDMNDDYLLELAVQSHADFLVTGDDDLLTLEKIDDTAIISVSAFQAILSML